MTSLVTNIKNIFLVFFTPFPYYLCWTYDKFSNFGSYGISLGFINIQSVFWISNGFMFFIWITKNIFSLYYLRFILFIYSIYLYYSCINQTIYLFQLLNQR
jgi:hypothetical protein